MSLQVSTTCASTNKSSTGSAAKAGTVLQISENLTEVVGRATCQVRQPRVLSTPMQYQPVTVQPKSASHLQQVLGDESQLSCHMQQCATSYTIRALCHSFTILPATVRTALLGCAQVRRIWW